MFRLLKDSDDIIAHAEEVWAREGDRSMRHPDTDSYGSPYKYPCLGTAIINCSYGGRPRFTHIYCHKSEAKRLVYPSTNKNRNKNSFRFAENYDALWEMINTDSRRNNIDDGRIQSRILDKVHQLIGLNGSFPALYTYMNAPMSRDTRIFRPIVLPLYIAKKLVYYKSSKKLLKTVKAHSVLTRPMQAIPMPDTHRGHIVMNLSTNASGVVRFTRVREQDFLFREQHELDKMNREMDRDLEEVGDNNRYDYVKRILKVFTEWRKTKRRMHARRFPQDVLHDATNQHLLKITMSDPPGLPR